MMEFGKITGVLEGTKLQVQLRDKTYLYAPISVMGMNVTLPSAQWVIANKDSFLALVAYEDDQLTHPLIVGFYPVKGADSEQYNVTEQLIAVVDKLIQAIIEAKTSTQLGPMPFMPDTQTKLAQEKTNLQKILAFIGNVTM